MSSDLICRAPRRRREGRAGRQDECGLQHAAAVLLQCVNRRLALRRMASGDRCRPAAMRTLFVRRVWPRYAAALNLFHSPLALLPSRRKLFKGLPTRAETSFGGGVRKRFLVLVSHRYHYCDLRSGISLGPANREHCLRHIAACARLITRPAVRPCSFSGASAPYLQHSGRLGQTSNLTGAAGRARLINHRAAAAAARQHCACRRRAAAAQRWSPPRPGSASSTRRPRSATGLN